MNEVELLAPAGDYDCFMAAMLGGADAVYLSGEKFGARAYAKNFNTDELVKAIETAHLLKRKIYLTVNTLVKDDELSELYDYLCPFYKAGLDGVIVQDIGVIKTIKELFNDLPVHASTQLAITSYEGLKLLRELGVERTVLARELTLSEIKTIHSEDDMELECFVHGALCYSYSGKCLFSSMVGGRSGNRGRCAGSCRQPYNDDRYLLSTKDINCLRLMPELIDAGIISFKIEGRMKSPEYVYGVTKIYRKYIDLYFENRDKFSIDDIKNKIYKNAGIDKDFDILNRLYTRGGNSEGYYLKHNGKEMISISDASYKSHNLEDIYNPYALSNADTLSAKLKITGYIRIAVSEPVLLTINYEDYSVSYYGNVVEEASNRPLEEETVKKQLYKTGDSEFVFDDLICDIEGNCFLRISELNELRRNALNELRNQILLNTRREIKQSNQHLPCDIKETVRNDNFNYDKLNFSVSVSNIEQLQEVCNYAYIKRVYVPLNIFNEFHSSDYFDVLKNNGTEIFLSFQSVIRYDYLRKNRDNILEKLQYLDGALIDNNELIYFLRNEGFTKEIVGDVHLYGLNKQAASTYKSLGVDKLTVPLELNKYELKSRREYGEELIIYGYAPLMISAQWVNKTINSCDKVQKSIALKDRTNAVFTAVNNCETCNNVIYNSVPVSLHNEMDLISQIKPAMTRIVFTIETINEVGKVMDYFKNPDFAKNTPPYKNFTKGHINRGVM